MPFWLTVSLARNFVKSIRFHFISSLSQYFVPVGGSVLREYLMLTTYLCASGARRKVQETDVHAALRELAWRSEAAKHCMS